jgi:hypothetical protein
MCSFSPEREHVRVIYSFSVFSPSEEMHKILAELMALNQEGFCGDNARAGIYRSLCCDAKARRPALVSVPEVARVLSLKHTGSIIGDTTAGLLFYALA